VAYLTAWHLTGCAPADTSRNRARRLLFSGRGRVEYHPPRCRHGTAGTATEGHREEELMHGLIAAAGLSTRLQDLGEKRNKVLLDLGGDTLLGTILTNFQRADIAPVFVVVGFDAPAVRTFCTNLTVGVPLAGASTSSAAPECILNPFFAAYGILGSVWLARQHLDGVPFVFTTGDHYFAWERFDAFLHDQPEADVLVDVEIKTCDDEDMKVFLSREGKLRTITKTFLRGPVLGEFTGAVRFSAEGSRGFFDTLDKHVWQHGIQGYVADVLCAYHRKWELAFHLSADHRRVEVDFPCDLDRARDLYRQERTAVKRTG
jgi:choline kinase